MKTPKIIKESETTEPGPANYAFIDNENVNLSVQSQGWKIDRAKLRRWLADKHNVTTAYMFMGYTPESQDMYHFFQNLGYTLIFKPMTGASGGIQKGNVDAELVLQAMIDFESYDQAIIISGDGDFACLVRYLYSKGKLETLIVPDKRRYSGLLKHAAKEKILSFNPLKRELAYTFRTRTPKKSSDTKHSPRPQQDISGLSPKRIVSTRQPKI